MRILVVDDSKAMRMIVIRALRQAGYGDYTFEEASNGKEALAAILKSPPDLVLSDWNMPEMTGYELLQALAENETRVRFGFVTSEGNVEMRTKALEAGALFLLTKPFTAEAMRDAVRPILG